MGQVVYIIFLGILTGVSGGKKDGFFTRVFRGGGINDLTLSFLTQTVLLWLSTWPVCNLNLSTDA